MNSKFTVFILLAALSFSFLVKPATFVVDTQKSSVVWTAKKVTGGHTGNVQISSGTLDIDNNTLAGGRFELDMRTITATDITDTKSNGKFIGHMHSEDFFHTAKYPTASLQVVSAESKGQNNYEVKGNLTIKGVTQPISFPATVVVSGNTLSGSAKITVDRTKYGIRYGSNSFFDNLGDKAIYDNFDLNVSLVATQE